MSVDGTSGIEKWEDDMTTTLRIELEVRDYDQWREAFSKDAGRRAENGMRRYRIFRSVDNRNHVMLDGDFDDVASAQRFLEIMRSQVWPDPAKAPAKLGQPRTAIMQLAESHEYQRVG